MGNPDEFVEVVYGALRAVIVVAQERLAEFGRFRRIDLERWQAIIEESKLRLD